MCMTLVTKKKNKKYRNQQNRVRDLWALIFNWTPSKRACESDARPMLERDEARNSDCNELHAAIGQLVIASGRTNVITRYTLLLYGIEREFKAMCRWWLIYLTELICAGLASSSSSSHTTNQPTNNNIHRRYQNNEIGRHTHTQTCGRRRTEIERVKESEQIQVVVSLCLPSRFMFAICDVDFDFIVFNVLSIYTYQSTPTNDKCIVIFKLVKINLMRFLLFSSSEYVPDCVRLYVRAHRRKKLVQDYHLNVPNE